MEVMGEDEVLVVLVEERMREDEVGVVVEVEKRMDEVVVEEVMGMVGEVVVEVVVVEVMGKVVVEVVGEVVVEVVGEVVVEVVGKVVVVEDEDDDVDVEDDDDVVDGCEEVDDFLDGGGRETDLAHTACIKPSRCFSISGTGRNWPASTMSLAANWCIVSLRSLVDTKMVLGVSFGGVRSFCLSLLRSTIHGLD